MLNDKNNNTHKEDEKSSKLNDINDFKERVAAIKGKQDPSSIKGILADKPPVVVLPMGKRISNFFYVNKFSLIVGICVATAFIWLASSFIPKTGNFDLNTVFLTQLPLNANEYLVDPIVNFVNDRDGNGEKNIEIEFLQSAGGDPAYSNTGVSATDLATAKFISIFQDYSAPLLFLDEANYNYLKTEYSMKFADLSTITGNEVKDDRIALKDTNLFNDFINTDALQGIYVVLIDVNSLGEKYYNNVDYMEKYNNAVDYVKKLVE